MTTAQDPFALAYMGARDLQEAEKNRDPTKLKQFDFGVTPQCLRCSKPCFDMVTKQWTQMKCGGCQAVIYCSRACQVADWKKNLQPRAPSHKELCPKNKEYMMRLPYFRSVFEQFPWARIEPDGTCSHDLLKARIGVLGSGPTFGYWSVPGGQKPHDDSPDILSSNPRPRTHLSRDRPKSYMHGDVMLVEEWPTDIEAWKLREEKQIPLLFFTDESPAPKKVEAGTIKDWASWYQWRGLAFTSPAAVLMDFPLSVYHLLIDVLRVVDLQSTPEKRQSLVVHYIGAEVELNFLPLFSELALLLPNTDLELVIFGKAGYDLVRLARKEYPGSIATNDTIWSYTAPRKSGGGSIKIRIYSKDENWSRDTVNGGPLPDAMIGLNAGILSYRTWGEPVIFSTILDIPFAVTEYAEQSADQTASHLATMRGTYAKSLGGSSRAYSKLMQPSLHPVAVNPFHRPGQRALPVIRMPNLYNGFTILIMAKVV